MGRNKFYLFLAIIMGIAVSGCASMSDVLKSKDDGMAVNYPINESQAWDIAFTVLRWEDCETIESHKSQGYLLTTVGRNFISEGSLVGVWFEKIGDNNTKVTIVTKRKISTNLATGLTEGTFHRRFEQAVKIIKSGKKLPIEAPPYSSQYSQD